MKILTINGSARINSSNQKLLKFLSETFTDFKFTHFDISKLPLFLDRDLQDHITVASWKQAIKDADALLITSPEYLSNIPAALKNSFEWLNKESILANKKVVPIIFTPQAPRGDKAMQSLLWSLQSLHADIAPSLSLHHSDFTSVNESLQANNETYEMIDACLENLRS